MKDVANCDKLRRAVKQALTRRFLNGKTFNSIMPAQNLSDEQVANVLTYVYNSWGNSKLEVKPEQVQKVRSGH